MLLIAFSVLLTIIVMLLIIQITNVVFYQQSIKRSPILKVACAGSEKPGTLKEYKVTNLQWNNFRKEDGSVLDKDSYRTFITMGDSMLLGGIRNSDILFVEEFNRNEQLTFPTIMVLQREQAAIDRAARFNDKAEMKIRRSWEVCTLDRTDEDIKNEVQNIIRSDQFQRIRSIDIRKFPDDEWLLCDFSERLLRYRNEHRDCEDRRNVNHKALISTTYDTINKRVHFSIHSYNTIIGEVKYAFGINNNIVNV